MACVDRDGEMIMCASPDTSGGKCTRHGQIKAMIDDRAAHCAGKDWIHGIEILMFSYCGDVVAFLATGGTMFGASILQ